MKIINPNKHKHIYNEHTDDEEKIMSMMKTIGIDYDCKGVDFCDCGDWDNHQTIFVSVITNKNKDSSTKFIIPIKTLVGKNKPDTYCELALTDIVLEENCIYGQFCPHKSNPLMCPLNHHDLGKGKTIIKKGEVIPDLLCRYERPWKMNKGGVMCCMHPQCWYNHGVGRKQRIMNNYLYQQ
jgi:hypothetical protein